MGAGGSGNDGTHCLTAWGLWAVELMQCTARLPGEAEQWNCHNALPYCLGALDSATPVMHRHNAWVWWAAELLLRTGPLVVGTRSFAAEAVAA